MGAASQVPTYRVGPCFPLSTRRIGLLTGGRWILGSTFGASLVVSVSFSTLQYCGNMATRFAGRLFGSEGYSSANLQMDSMFSGSSAKGDFTSLNTILFWDVPSLNLQAFIYWVNGERAACQAQNLPFLTKRRCAKERDGESQANFEEPSTFPRGKCFSSGLNFQGPLFDHP